MEPLRVAYQGERGAFSEAAAAQLLGDKIQPVPLPHFEDVFQAVEKGEADRGVLPIENSLAGSIHRNYDLLLRHELHIVGETFLRIEHCLIAGPGTKKSQVRRVYSHPQALDQCEHYLDGLGVRDRVSAHDTAGSVRMLREKPERDSAAIASRRAAEVYGMHVIDEGIEDSPANFTRFLCVAREPAARSEPARTSLVYSVPHKPGSLAKSLGIFALWEVNLTKLESRPWRGKTWEYLFYVDVEGHSEDPDLKRALSHLVDYSGFLRVLGSYPAGRMPQAVTDTVKRASR